ncbi:MAG: endonuclease III [Candidatus Aenigmatarchaeota archaeon]
MEGTILKIIEELNKVYRIEVRKDKPFEALIHGILSSRTKDEVTFQAQEKLLKKANTPEKILKLSVKEIEKLIYPVGFYRVKAKRIKQACKFLIENFKGSVPNKREELMKIPGVGGKIADIILLFGYSQKVIPVDVHVEVVAKRLGIADEKDAPEKVREKLHNLIPEKFRPIFNQLFVQFGREICQTRRPLCYKCPIIKYCPYEPKNLKQN